MPRGGAIPLLRQQDYSAVRGLLPASAGAFFVKRRRDCSFIAVTRPGYDLARLNRELPEAYVRRIHPIEAPGVDISSTTIRARIRAGAPIRYLVPDAVEAYIHKHALYDPGPPCER